MDQTKKNWRDSASLILLARDDGPKVPSATGDDYNYKILAFKRTEKTAFLPNHVVFPGGAFDRQDGSLEWNRLLLDGKVTPAAIASVTSMPEGCPRPPSLLQPGPRGELDRNISMRLCALRETFEEVGILLSTEVGGPSSTGYSTADVGVTFDVRTWQEAVHNGEKKFDGLYRTVNRLPDLWNVYEWSTWLTPTVFPKRRFETVFYLATLPEIPTVVPERHEVAEYIWDTPRGLLEAYKAERIWLAPPQAYEITRLSHVHDIEDVVQFARRRNKKGSTIMCPVQYFAADGVVGALPGDDLYPKDCDLVSNSPDAGQFSESSTTELLQRAQHVHRVVFAGHYGITFQSNQRPLDGHLHIGGDNQHLAKM